jgi:WD40 repeat protein/nucleoside phosphorylase
MQALSRYFAEKSLRKVRVKLSKAQQASVDTLISLMNEEGKVNFNHLRDTLSPLASSTNSANTMLGRFLDRINEAAKESSMVFMAVSTANKKAGSHRWVWFEGLAEAGVKPYTGDLNGVPEAVRMEDQRGMPLGRPVVLMTFNEHETRAILDAFAPAGQPLETEGAHTFTRLGIHGSQEVIHVISRQGRKFAQDTTARAIERHNPCAVIGVGIAFGVQNGKRRIGDVLVSDYLFDYESARLNADGKTISRGPRPPASRLLVDRIRALDHLRGEQIDWPKVIIGPIACGDKLVDSPAFLKQIQEAEPECVGGEMEGSGMEIAASAANVAWIVVKGISDWADGTKNTPSKDDDQKAAARNAAQVVKTLLGMGSLSPQPDKGLLPMPVQPPQASSRRQECRPPSARAMNLRDLFEVDGEDVDDTAKGVPTSLDAKRNADAPLMPSSAKGSCDVGEEGQAVLPYLRHWLQDPAAPRLFALLGEYGMGKTITCQLLAKQLDEERQNDPTRPIPLYFDLRHVTGLRERVPKLHEALEECMSRGWLDDGSSEGYTLANIHRWVAQSAVIIFDGLDEVLVKLTEADGKVFTDNLLKLIVDAKARAQGERRTLQLKVLITCRTQYFPNLQAQNSHFTQSERGEFSADRYRAMVLLPWREKQVRRYMSHALPGMDLDRLLEMVRSIHNLQELTQRPYTLKLVTEFIPEIENDRAAGRTVYGVTLYRRMAEKWLTRDSGKHHIKPEHKLRLAAHLAAYLWRTGRNALPAEDLNAWFHEWLETEADLRRRYNGLHPDQLEEDLRTATFLARQDDGEASTFRFAHTSLLEFFLARYLLSAVERNDAGAWAIPVPSRETLDFLGQLLGEAANPLFLQTLQAWRRPYVAQASELLVAYAFRASHEGWPQLALRGVDLRGARLRSWVLTGSAGRPMDLTGACFDGADLRDSTFRSVTLDQAGFVGADMSRINMLQCSARAANFQAATLTAAIFRYCQLEKTDWRQARGYRPQWLNCMPSGAPWLLDPGLALIKPLVAPSADQRRHEQLAWLAGCQSTFSYMCLAFSPDLDSEGRQWLAIADDDGTVRLWDVASGEAGPVLRGHKGAIFSCAFSLLPDGAGRQWLASAGCDGTVRLWDVASGEAGPVLRGHKGAIFSCAFSPVPDGAGRQWLASADDDGAVRLWDVTSGEAGPVLRGHEGGISSCAFSPGPDEAGQQWLASAGDDGTVRLWDVASGEAGPVLRGHEGRTYSCAFAPVPDGAGRQWLASAGGDGTVRLWDVASGEAGPVLRGHEGGISSCAFSSVSDGAGRQWLASAGDDGTVRLWDVASGEAGPVLRGHEGRISSCAFSPVSDGEGRQWLASAGVDGTVRLWDVANGEAGPVLRGHEDGISSCAFSPVPNGEGRQWLASAGVDGTVRLWDVASGEAGPVLRGHEGGISSCAFSPVPDGAGRQWLASAGVDGTVRLWDVASGEAGPVLRGHEGWISSCAFSPVSDGEGRQWLASAGGDGTVRLWDVASGEAGPVLRGHEGGIYSCAFAPVPDGAGRQWLASVGGDSTVRLWDVASGESGPVLRGHEGGIYSCAFAPVPDGAGRQRLASAGGDGTVRLWDVASGEAGRVIRGHERRIHSCAFAPVPDEAGRQWLASAGVDGIRLWDVASGEAGPVLRGHEGGLSSCAFDPVPDGAGRQWLASAGYDGTVQLWDAASGRCLRITALCTASAGGEAGHAVWEPETDRVLEVTGDAWRHLAWLRPLSNALPERLPLETFGPVPFKEEAA